MLLTLLLGLPALAADLENDDEKPTLAEPTDERRTSKAKEDESSAASAASALLEKDRVRSIQQKPYLKRGRVSLTALGNLTLNDAFYSKVGGSVGAAYYVRETLAIGVRASLISVIADDDLQTAKANFQSVIVSSNPGWSAMGELEWSPLYGKVHFYNSILHLDGYLFGGLGAVAAPSPEQAFALGVGIRVVAKEWLAFNIAFQNTSYVSTPAGSSLGLIQNLMTLNIGVSLFIPFSSTAGAAE
jgi:outer membrane beta-barrel protein